jgi:hypothetical protein
MAQDAGSQSELNVAGHGAHVHAESPAGPEARVHPGVMKAALSRVARRRTARTQRCSMSRQYLELFLNNLDAINDDSEVESAARAAA